VLFAAGTILFSGISTHAALFLRIEGIPGEATDPDHEDWINLLGFSQPIQSPVISTKSPATADFQVRKELDKSSPKLAEALAKGMIIPEVELEYGHRGDSFLRFYHVVLRNVLIHRYEVDSVEGAQPVESLGFDFEKAEWTYLEVDATGKPLGSHQAYWDFVRNEGGSGTERLGFAAKAVYTPGEPLRIRWQAEDGRAYQVLRTTRLGDSFQPYQDIEAGGAGERFIDLPVGGRFEFFILREQ